jgi:multiple sugar transport system ATP-binding protein
MNFLPCAPAQDDGRLVLTAAPLTIDVPPHLKRSLEQRTRSDALTLGIRPVDLSLAMSPVAEAIGAGTVTLIENLGDEQIVAIAAGDHAVESLVSINQPVRVGDQVWMKVDQRRIHVFDPASGRSLAA